MSQLWRK